MVKVQVCIHLRAEPVMQPLVNHIYVVKTGSRAPNEPLLNRSYGSAESRFFRRTQRDAQFKLGRRHGRILLVLLFASILLIMVQWTEEESLQLIDVYKTNAILWDPKHISHYKKNQQYELTCLYPRSGSENTFPLEILDPILLSIFSKSVGDILVKFFYCPQMYWDFMSTISCYPDRFFYSSVRHQRRVFLFLLFKLAIINAA